MQKSLFDAGHELPPHCQSAVNQSKPEPLARRSDPPTSHDAAADIQAKLSGCKAQFVAALQRLGEPSTAHEIAAAAESSASSPAMRETYRKRAAELVKAGAILTSGERACKITGKTATVYKLA